MKRRIETDSDADSDAENENEGPSKTQLKKESMDLRELGTALLGLPDAQLDDIEMEDDLRRALRELRRLRSLEARRRQTLYVGKLLRQADLEPLHRALTEQRVGATRLLQEIERWRERLLAGDEGMTAWIEAHPDGNTQQFRTLVRNARQEKSAALAADPDSEAGRGGKGRFYRDLFQKVRAVLESEG